MYTSTKAIVLSSTKYQEKSLIVKCFTEADGICVFFVKNAFGKSKSQYISYFQPLTLLEIQYQERNKNSMYYFHKVQLSHPFTSISTQYHKSIVALFLAEILQAILPEKQENKRLYSFLEHSLLWYDTCIWNADFHLFVLFQTTKFLGFYPDDSYTNHTYFNKKEGYFTNNFSQECLDAEDSVLFKKGLALQLDTSSTLNGSERKKILQLIIDYYHTHLQQPKNIHSLSVISELY